MVLSDRMVCRYKVLVHPNTIKILKVLKNGSLSFTEIMFTLNMSPSVLSSMLKKLSEMGFVEKCESKYIITDRGYELLEKLLDIINMI